LFRTSQIDPPDPLEPLRPGGIDLDDIEPPGPAAFQLQDHGGEKADGAQPRDQAVLPPRPVRIGQGIRQATGLQQDRFVDGLFSHRGRLTEHGHVGNALRDGNKVLLRIDDALCLITVLSPDPPLPVTACFAHIRPVHQAGKALPATAPDREEGIVS